jgi:hypothetical protein
VTSPAPKPARRRGDIHAIELREHVDELERKVDDLLLVARVVAVLLGVHSVVQLLEQVA